jgi:hypothetical protein
VNSGTGSTPSSWTGPPTTERPDHGGSGASVPGRPTVLPSNWKGQVIMWESVKRTVVRNLGFALWYLTFVHGLHAAWVLVGRPVLVIIP